jgi:hypothetical protein
MGVARWLRGLGARCRDCRRTWYGTAWWSSPAALSSGTTTAALPRCKPAALSESGSGNGGLGHIAYRVEFRNFSNQGCSLTGYPVATASLVGAGSNAASTIARTVNQELGYSGGIDGLTKVVREYQHHSPVVSLKPHGGAASVVVEFGDLIRKSCPSTVNVTIRLPDANSATAWLLPLHGILCTRVLYVHPIVPGVTGFLNAR